MTIAQLLLATRSVQILQPIRLIPAYWVCRRGTLPRWPATAVRCGTCKAVHGGGYCLCTTPLQLAGRLAGSWLAGRAWSLARLTAENSWCPPYSSTVLRSVLVPFYEGFGTVRSRYGTVVGRPVVPSYVNCGSHTVPSLCTVIRSTFLRKLCEGSRLRLST